MKLSIAAVSAISLLVGAGLAPVLSAAADTPAEAQALPATPVDPARLSAHVKVLSSDAFEGRGPATPAEVKTLD